MAEAPAPNAPPPPASLGHAGHVRWGMVGGWIAALIGLVDGVVMASKRHVAPCPDGKYFPEGTTNFNCYVHPHAGLGIAIAAFSILLGIVVWLAGMSAEGILRGHGPGLEGAPTRQDRT